MAVGYRIRKEGMFELSILIFESFVYCYDPNVYCF